MRRSSKYVKILSILLINILLIQSVTIFAQEKEVERTISTINISNKELEKKIRYGEVLIRYVKYDNNLQNAINKAKQALELNSTNIESIILNNLIGEIRNVSNGKSDEFLDQLLKVEDKLYEIEYMDTEYYSEESLESLSGTIWTIEYNLRNFFKNMSLYQVQRYYSELERDTQNLESIFYKINSNNTLTNIVDVFNPKELSDGYYQVHRGEGWISDESDLITSGILEGEGSDNSIKLSQSTSRKVVHGLNIDVAVKAEINKKAEVGVAGGFGWNPEQTATSITASTLMKASEDKTLYVKLYTMNEKVETYRIENGKIVEEIESYNPIGTVGIYGEEDSAYDINILDYYIGEPVQVKMWKANSQLNSMNYEAATPMIHHEEVIERGSNTIDTISVEEEYTKVDSEEVTNDEAMAMSEGDNTNLEDGVYTRFLGAGWIIGGDGHIATSTVMPGSIGSISETVDEGFKVVHSIGIQAGVEGELATSKVKATLKASYSNAVETNEKVTVEVKTQASNKSLKQINAYENNFKYDVITVKNNKIIEQSEAYISEGVYAKVVEDRAPVILEEGEERQVLNSLVNHEFTPSISQNHDIYIVGALDRGFNKIFNASIKSYSAEDSVNINFQVEESGIYKFRAARVFGPKYTPNFEGYATALREPEYYAKPQYVKVFNVNSLNGKINYEEYYKVAEFTQPTYGGTYYEIYLEAGEDYVMEVGASTMTESFIPPGGYVPGYGQEVDPEDMYGNIFEIEKTLPYFSNAGVQVELESLLEVYNEYEEKDYLKESFIEFENIREYANILVDRGLYAIPYSVTKTIENLKSSAEKLINIDEYNPDQPDFEYNPDEYYIKVNPDTETTEKIPADNPAYLEDGIYMIDRGYGWIKSEEDDLVNSAVLDSDIEEGRINVSKSVTTSTSHDIKTDIFAGVKFAEIFKVGITLGFQQTISESKTIQSNHILEVPEGNKGYLKVYTVNNKYETIQVENGKIIDTVNSYDPIGTIGMTAIVEDGTINENYFIMQDDYNIFNGGIDGFLPTEPVEPTDPSVEPSEPTTPPDPTKPPVEPTDPTGPQIQPTMPTEPTMLQADSNENSGQSTLYDVSKVEKIDVTEEILKITEISFDDILSNEAQDTRSMPSNIKVGETYKLDKTISQLNSGQTPNTTLISNPTLDVNGVYLQYLGDGFINGEDSFINTVTADPYVRGTLETKTETKSFTEGGAKLEVSMEVGIFESVISTTYKFKQETGEIIRVGASTYDESNKSQLKIYDMYKNYRVYEVKNGQLIDEQILSINSGIYAKAFEPGDYTTALSEEVKRSTLSTKQSSFNDTSKNAYTGGADSIIKVNIASDGSVEPINRVGYTLDTNISNLQNGYYLIDLGDNWIQNDTKNLVGSNANFTTVNNTEMKGIIEQEISTETQYSGEGSLNLSKKYSDVLKLSKLKTSMSILVGGGSSIGEGSKASVRLDIPKNNNGLLKLYESSRRTDLVEVRDGKIVDMHTTYLPNGIIATALVENSQYKLNQNELYIGKATKNTVSDSSSEKIEIYTKFEEEKPLVYIEDNIQITPDYIKNNTELSKVIYNSESGKLKNGTYSFYLGDWYTGESLAKHYIVSNMSGELKRAVTAQTSMTIKTAASLGQIKDTVIKSIGGSLSKTIKDSNTITSGSRGTSYEIGGTLELRDRYQRFLTLTITNGKVIDQVVTSQLIGTDGILK